MPIRIALPSTFKDVLARTGRPLAGMWVCSGSPLMAELCAGAGLDWVLIDTEHSPNGLESVVAQLQAVSSTPSTPVVRLPGNDPVLIKQYLDLGAQNLLIPMVHTPAEARAAVAACRYPPDGIRGVGSSLSRSARWNRVSDYLATASESITLAVQIESAEAVGNAGEIAATDGIDAVFIGPSDLAASMGLIGQQEHPDVVDAVTLAIRSVRSTGTPVGVNAFAEPVANRYLELGVDFIAVGADVALLARGSEALARTYIPSTADDPGTSY